MFLKVFGCILNGVFAIEVYIWSRVNPEKRRDAIRDQLEILLKIILMMWMLDAALYGFLTASDPIGDTGAATFGLIYVAIISIEILFGKNIYYQWCDNVNRENQRKSTRRRSK